MKLSKLYCLCYDKFKVSLINCFWKKFFLFSLVSEGLEFFNFFEVIWGEIVKIIVLKFCYGYSGMYCFFVCSSFIYLEVEN